MKKLHWQKLPPARLQGTLWQSLEWKSVKINREEIETLFCAPKDRSNEKAVGENSLKQIKDDKIRFFDSKRANNIGIMMSQFRVFKLLSIVSIDYLI